MGKAGEVIQLVAKNFKKVVDGSRDIFIKYYAPWCGHCKAMAQDYIDLAAELPDVAIAEFDATANDNVNAKFEFTGFPTLFWVPKGTTVPVPYSSGRSKANMLEFINNNRTP